MTPQLFKNQQYPLGCFPTLVDPKVGNVDLPVVLPTIYVSNLIVVTLTLPQGWKPRSSISALRQRDEWGERHHAYFALRCYTMLDAIRQRFHEKKIFFTPSFPSLIHGK